MSKASHILIVDDEADMRDAVREYLTLRGFRISEAADGDEMNTILVDDAVDLILLDLNLPGEDGIILTRRLKSERDVGIIIVPNRVSPVGVVANVAFVGDENEILG